jgi:periplasmic protein TonB
VITRPFFFFAISSSNPPEGRLAGVHKRSCIQAAFEEDAMFADSFCDSGWSNNSHRGWTTLISFAVQAALVACLLLLPLLYTQGLPHLTLLAPRLLAPAPPPAAPPAPLHPSSSAQSNLMGDRLVAPLQVPPSIEMVTETVAPPPMVDPGAIGINHATGSFRDSVGSSMAISGLAVPPPPPPPPVVRRPPSHMMEGNLIFRVQPEYPAIARQARVQGQVMLRATISREGVIENLQPLSGPPILIRAAIDAVRQWRYRPYVLNGEPIAVETEVKVNFVLSGG